MIAMVYILGAALLIYLTLSHPTQKWTMDGKQYPAPRIVVLVRELFNPGGTQTPGGPPPVPPGPPIPPPSQCGPCTGASEYCYQTCILTGKSCTQCRFKCCPDQPHP